MPNRIEGINPAVLLGAQKNALAILVSLTAVDLAQLKHELHLGFPSMVGTGTLAAFVALARARGFDLSDSGVHAFKLGHGLDDTGANEGAIGPSTAAAYARAIAAAAPAPEGPRRHISARGLAAIENFEGLYLSAYRDQVGVPTIGWGHTAGVEMGQTITRAQAEAFLRADLAVAEEAVSRLVSVPLSENEFAALVSFTFNCGTGALAGATLLKLLNARDYQGAASAFGSWVKGEVDGQLVTIPGLVARRAEEAALFLEP